MRVVTVVGTRPEIIKLSCVIQQLDKHTDHLIIHTGQNYDYELNQVFFEELGIRKPDIFLEAAGSNSCETVANVINKSWHPLNVLKPDALLIYGDTNSCMVAYTAKRLRIPVFHMEAGNRCFDERVPEEINRRIIDHISDINMTITEHAKSYLLSEGVRPETIFSIGSSMPEVLNKYSIKISESSIRNDLKLDFRDYILVSCHREENVDHNLYNFSKCLNSLAKDFEKPIVVSTHPRTQKALDKHDFDFDERIIFHKPFGFFDYMRLQMDSTCVVSDSGTVTEEAALCNFPAVTIRQTHERPEGMDGGVLIMSDLHPIRLRDAVKAATELNVKVQWVEGYSEQIISHKVVKIILSYTDYINRTVWRQNNA